MLRRRSAVRIPKASLQGDIDGVSENGFQIDISITLNDRPLADRLIAATAMEQSAELVTKDAKIWSFLGVRAIW